MRNGVFFMRNGVFPAVSINNDATVISYCSPPGQPGRRTNLRSGTRLQPLPVV